MHSNLASTCMAGRPTWAGLYAISHESQLWQRLRDDADPTARDELLDLHMSYARVVARTYYAKRMHDEIEFADYLQLASLGLVEALDRFDPEGCVVFKTFAARRMHGAIVDGVKRLTEKHQLAAQHRMSALPFCQRSYPPVRDLPTREVREPQTDYFSATAINELAATRCPSYTGTSQIHRRGLVRLDGALRSYVECNNRVHG